MHLTDPSRWRHSHAFCAHPFAAERRTQIVAGVTAAMMIIEISAGLLFHSMALLADGWHMGTHLAAFLITTFAYYFSRRHSNDPRYSFGTGKIGVLGGFASAVLLAVIAVFMAAESVHRLFSPLPIHFDEAIAIGCVSLAVNLVCALVLRSDNHPHDLEGHGPHHHSHHRDLNLRAAYVHVLADSLTSFGAICALLAGKFLGWSRLDPAVAIVGSAVVLSWAYSLLRATSGILLDRTPESTDLDTEIKRAIENDGDSLITDLHIWQVGAGIFAAIISVVAHRPKSVASYRELLREHAELVHVTIETNVCEAEEHGRGVA